MLTATLLSALPSSASPTRPPTAPPATRTPIPPSPSAVSGLPHSCIPATSSRPDSIGDVYYPQLGNAGYDAEHYTLDLAVNVAANTLSGTSTLRAHALARLPAFNLDFHGLTIDALSVDGTPAAYTRTGDELTINLPTPMDVGTVFTAAVTYHGEPEIVFSPAVDIPLGWHHTPAGIYVVSEPAGAEGWYPVNDHPCDKATYTFHITVPHPYVVAANGRLVATEDHGATTTYLWEAQDPAASYLVTLGIADLVQRTARGPDGLPIRHFFPRALAAAADRVFADTAEMIAYFSTRFGPYPFETYGALVADADFDYALETQTLALFDRGLVTSAGQADAITAHELAHQWFGDSVSLRSWRDIWLAEGFASYGEALWIEHRQGWAALDAYMERLYRTVYQRGWPPPANPPATDLFNGGVYLRGALTLHALRLRVGDDVFFRILRTYTARYRHANASTADFIAVATEISGQDLQSLFDSWLYADTLPDLPGTPTPAVSPTP